jgi:uncharacterized membrane protein YgdD (TMEM256/DUF423 family)
MRAWLLCGAANAFLAVAAGAFAAHGLKRILDLDMLETFRTAATYEMYHALALILVGLLTALRPSVWADAAGYAFTLGIVLFSGSLYALSITGVRALGAITPFGGVSFLAGWVFFAIAAWKST